MRLSVFLLIRLAVATILLTSAALAAPDVPASEPPAPQPSPAVQKLLDEAAHPIETKEQPQALKVAGDALAAALAIHTAGNRLFDLREVVRARRLWAEALAIREKHAPGSMEMGKSLYNLGLGAYDQGELDVAEAFDRRALDIEEKQAPNST